MARLDLTIAGFDDGAPKMALAGRGGAVLRGLRLADDAEHVNPTRGAIALGHRLGMSGARLALKAGHALHKRAGAVALCTVCIDAGRRVAPALEKV